MEYGKTYVIGFATIICLVCGVIVASSAVGLRDRQEGNKLLDRQKKVLVVAGLVQEGEALTREQVTSRFESSIRPVVVDLATGRPVEGVDPHAFDQATAAKDPATSRLAPPNPAKVARLPNHALVYEVVDGGELQMVVIPVEGKGLWSTLFGFLAVGNDGNTILGITFYQHGETPGLGGEVDNPQWKGLWPGRRIFDENGKPAIRVIKGRAGQPDEQPFAVDGLSGATLTSNGVTALVQFWAGEHGFGRYLANLGASGGAK